jgi:hypothetical protein
MLLPSATVFALEAPEQLLPICCRAHGAHSCIMGMMQDSSSDAGPLLRDLGCPYRQGLHAVTTGSLTADFSSRARFGFLVANVERQATADFIATSVLRRSVPRGPPSSLSL